MKLAKRKKPVLESKPSSENLISEFENGLKMHFKQSSSSFQHKEELSDARRNSRSKSKPKPKQSSRQVAENNLR
jgi:hypothetical protein